MKIYEKKYVDGVCLSTQGTFSENEEVKLQLIIPRRCGATRVFLHLYGEGIENRLYRAFELDWIELDGKNDLYLCKIDCADVGVGLYFYKYEIISDESVFYGKISPNGELCEIPKDSNDGLIQLLVYKPSENKPEWIYGGIMYHVFVDRFCKSGKCEPKSGAIMNDDWYNGIPQYASVPGGFVENNMFFGGDLYGVASKLDFLKSLGVNCLYLSPIFEAYSNHKYDTADYMSIDSMFGGEEAFDFLLSEAKKRDIHVILDGVFNHTGADSIYFNKNASYNSLGAYQSVDSKYFEWYNFKNYPDDYECWWNVKILPRVKSDTPSYKNYILGNHGVVEKWMKKGIDGFRLDVADELSDDFLKTLNEKVKGINPSGIVYGEVWEDASNKIAYGKRKKYFLGNELDSVMNYPLREAIIEYVKYGKYEQLVDVCHMLYSHYPKSNANTLMNVLGTHDTERILTVLGEDDHSNLTNAELSVKKMTNTQRKNAIQKLKLAYTILATVPGIPCIYYGDEAGMEGYRDPFNRKPYPWGKEEHGLIEFYKKIGEIRLSSSAYKEGNFKIIECNENVLVFVRYTCEKNLMLTVVNRSDNAYTIYSSESLTNAENNRRISRIKPNSSYILKVNSGIDDFAIELIN